MGKSTHTEDESECIHRIYRDYFIRSDNTDDFGGRGEMIKMKNAREIFHWLHFVFFFQFIIM